jgi:hypothetical protein
MSSVREPFAFPTSVQPDPFAPSPTGLALELDDPDLVSRPTPTDMWLELTVRWGATTLISRLCDPAVDIVLVPQEDRPIDARPVTQSARLELALPSPLLGSEPIVLTLGGLGHTRLVVPSGAGGTYYERRQGRASSRSIPELLAHRAPSREFRGRVELALLPEATFELEAFGLSFTLGLVSRERPIGKGMSFDRSYASYLALSLSTFGSLLAALAYFTPPLGLGDENAIDKRRLVLVQHYLSALAQREQEVEPESKAEADAAPGGEASAPAPGKPGEAGAPQAERKAARLAVKGPSDQPNVELSRDELRTLAQNFGLIGMLRSDALSDPEAPFSAFARDVAIGHDAESARGNLWGLDIGEAAGQNGLYLSGTSFGGLDGPGTGVGISGVFSGLGTLGQCTPGAGKVCAFGGSVGRNGGTHAAKGPIIRTSQPTVGGRLPAEVVQRIVRQNFGRFRFCYEKGLALNPSLEGRVAVRFVIDRSGAVSTSSAESGGLPDPAVARCVAQGFLGLSFPPPEGGIVSVTYPLMFSPG